MCRNLILHVGPWRAPLCSLGCPVQNHPRRRASSVPPNIQLYNGIQQSWPMTSIHGNPSDHSHFVASLEQRNHSNVTMLSDHSKDVYVEHVNNALNLHLEKEEFVTKMNIPKKHQAE